MKRTLHSSRLPLTLLVLLATTGCGYRSGQAAGGEGRTIAVPMFGNQTYRRDLERDLTRAVHDELRGRSNYRLVDLGSDPDLVLEGKLVSASEGVLSERSKGRIRESSAILTVVVTLRDRRSGEKVIEKVRLTERQPFVPVKGESLRSAQVAAMRGLAERIVYALSATW